MIQNTSMTFNDIEELTIPQLEALYDGFEEVNKDIDKRTGNGSEKPLEDLDAIKFMQQQGSF